MTPTTVQDIVDTVTDGAGGTRRYAAPRARDISVSNRLVKRGVMFATDGNTFFV